MVNKERHFQELATEKHARTHVCLSMKTRLKKYFMLCSIQNDYGDNHHVQTRDISPEKNSSVVYMYNCFRSSIVTFLVCKVM